MRTLNVERRTLNVEVMENNRAGACRPGPGRHGPALFSLLQRSMFDLRRSTFTLLLLFILQAGCARLTPGTFTPAPQPKIFLLRGYLDWYSTGIDRLTTELRDDGQSAEAYREEQWGDLANWLIQHPQRPLVLIGFSYGADDVILIARRLSVAHLPVDLLITMDPVTPADLPPNVKRAVNFYEPNGFWDIFPWLRGVPVPGSQNINIRARADLNQPNTSHATIAANEKVHAVILKLIRTGV